MTDDERKLMDVTESAVAAALARPCPDPDHLLCWVCAKIKHEDEFPQCDVAGHAVCNDCLEDGDRLYDLVGMLEVELAEAEMVIVAVTEAMPLFQTAAKFETPVIDTLENYATGVGKIIGALTLYRAWLKTYGDTGPREAKP